jgi:hypothetical protein
VTKQERISRETLLRRAAALAGAVYVAPVLTSSAVARDRDHDACRSAVRSKCGSAKDCTIPKQSCICCPEDRFDAFQCRETEFNCGSPFFERCCREGEICDKACDVAHVCHDNPKCACFLIAGFGQERTCREIPEFCSDVPPERRCNKNTGKTTDDRPCPDGMACVLTCCSYGLCLPPCPPRSARVERDRRRARKSELFLQA